ncbi:unnamed protein product [Pedinophyceae sp. YPF-701]|nr:unnamed protein product [Pedinophyceae sp. YPF-701]
MGCVSGKPSKEEEARERRDREVLAPPERGDECHFHIQREPRGNRFKFLKGGGDFNGDPRTYPLWLKCEREGEFGQNERLCTVAGSRCGRSGTERRTAGTGAAASCCSGPSSWSPPRTGTTT